MENSFLYILYHVIFFFLSNFLSIVFLSALFFFSFSFFKFVLVLLFLILTFNNPFLKKEQYGALLHLTQLFELYPFISIGKQFSLEILTDAWRQPCTGIFGFHNRCGAEVLCFCLWRQIHIANVQLISFIDSTHLKSFTSNSDTCASTLNKGKTDLEFERETYYLKSIIWNIWFKIEI